MTTAVSRSADTPRSVAAAETCVQSLGPGSDAALRISIGSGARCVVGDKAVLTIENSTDAECTSNVSALIDGQEKMLFWSDSGFGGARGYWGPPPDERAIYDGVMQHPPGTRTWKIDLPTLTVGEHHFDLLATCPAAMPTGVALVARFEVVGAT